MSQHKDSLLFTPLQLGNVTLPNRICISPMCQYSCQDGMVTDWHLVHLGARAVGGAGLVMVEATAVEPRGRISDRCVGIWSEEHCVKLKQICDFITSQNSVPAIQLAHAGRKASTYPPYHPKGRQAIPDEDGGWDTIGASPIAFGNGNDRVPKEATQEDIDFVKASFVQAAQRAVKCGFKIIELHFAHGYLVQSFLSPASNKRTDKYGGSFENRIRLALEIVEDVKAILPQDYPVFVRLSCTEYTPEGWDLDQSIQLCHQLKRLGINLIDCSSGGNIATSKKSFIYNNVDQVSLAESIQKEVDIPTGAVGCIVNPRWAEEILQSKKATLVLIGRISLDDPNWPLHAAFELGAEHQFQVATQYRYSIGATTPGSWRQRLLTDNNQTELKSANKHFQNGN